MKRARFFADVARRMKAPGLIATLALLASAPPAFGQSLPVVRVGIISAELDAQMFYGVDREIFKKYGVEVQLQPFANGNAIAAGLAAGAIDVGHVEILTMISAHSHSFPITYISPGLMTTNANPAFGILVKGDGPIHEARDFNNTVVGVALLNTVSQLPFQVWIDNNGGNSKTIKFIEVPLPAMQAAVANGTVAATTPPEPFLTFGADAGERVILMQKNTMAPSFILNGWAVSKDWLAKNRHLARQVASGLRESSAWANDNPGLIGPILSKYTKMPEPLIARTRRARFADAFSTDELQPTIDAAARYGIIVKSFPATDIFERL